MSKLALDRNAHFLSNAYALAHLAHAAYAENPQAHASFQRTVFAEPGAELIRFEDAETDTQGFICGDAEHVVVAFRGTEVEKLRDWLTDLSVRMMEAAELGGRVHEGFELSLDAVWDQVIKGIKKLSGAGQTLWVTGHSLGGALATLLARWLSADQRPFSVSTFGQPRVGDQGFARNYRRRHFRFVNNRDLVPTVPPRIMPGWFWPPAFYTHVGDLQFFDGKGRLVATTTGQELGVLPELVTALGPLSNFEAEAKALILKALEDHKPENYLRCLKRNLPK